MRRLAIGGIVAVILVALAGCSSTETGSTAIQGDTIYLVATSDSQSALNLIAWGSTKADPVKVVKGDAHEGTKTCSTTVKHEGHSYSLTLYIKGSVPATDSSQLCTVFAGSIFSS